MTKLFTFRYAWTVRGAPVAEQFYETARCEREAQVKLDRNFRNFIDRTASFTRTLVRVEELADVAQREHVA